MPQLQSRIPTPHGLLGAVLSSTPAGDKPPFASARQEASGWDYKPRPFDLISPYFSHSELDLPQVVSRPDRATVSRGMTVERLARNIYGEDWRAGVQAIFSANRLRLNGNGSPMLRVGQEVRLPALEGLTPAQWSTASRAGGRLVADNGAKLAENRELERLRTQDTSRYAGLVGEDREEAIQEEWERLEDVTRIATARALVKDRLVPRSQWATRAPQRGWLTKRNAKSPPYHIETLHHTGSKDTPQSVESLHRGSENWWRRPLERVGLPVQSYRGWGDVGYNFMIGPSGRIYEGRNLAYDGAHVRSHNAGNIGIAMLGDYSDRQLTKEQLESLKALMKDLQTRYAIDEVKTHGDLDPGKSDELKGARSQITPLLR